MTDHHQSVPHQLIPLRKLVLWDGNVRKVEGSDTALAELAASIAAHGLLQSLVVRKSPRGKYAVIAGGRRLAALRSLEALGQIDAGLPVPCHVIAAEANGTEVSLAENAMREDMHPADQFEAFRELADHGLPVADIAARFGTSDSTVEKRLRLARVAPVIVDAYRRDEITLECVMAFAVTDDHTAQEKLWNHLPEHRRHPQMIRASLTEDDIAASDRRVKFIGLKAYIKAGGAVRRDLFSEDDDGVFILDTNLLEQLVTAKLEKAAKTVRKEGWRWVETHPDFGYSEAGEFERRYPETVPLTDQETAELAALEQEIDASYDIEGDLTPEQQARLDVATERMDELSDNREQFWPEDTLAIAGSVVSIGYDGKAKITSGLVRPEDAPDEAEEEVPPGKTAPRNIDGLPASLLENLTAQRSVALSASLIETPEIALVAVVHALASEIFHSKGDTSSLQLSGNEQRFRGMEGSKAFEAIERARSLWGEQLPGDPSGLWTWCLQQRTDTLLELLAFCAALTIDAVQTKQDTPDAERLRHGRFLAEALSFDIAKWFKPTAANFFSRIAKPQILKALQDAKGVPPAPAWSGLKKAELAALAEREIASTGWMPEPLRSHDAVSTDPLKQAA